jgi:hypothetical protein
MVNRRAVRGFPSIRHVAILAWNAASGIHVKRDSEVSVRYAEELNSSQSSVLLQRADRHEILGQKPPGFQLSL